MELRRRLNLTTGWAEFDQADLVRVGGHAIPRRIDVTFPSTADKWPSAHFVIEVRRGVPVCTAFELRAHEEGREIKGVDLRAIRLEEWVENILAEASVLLTDHHDSASYVIGGAHSEEDFADARKEVRYARSGSRRSVTPEVLEEAASIYREHVKDRPVEAVAAAFQTSHRTAARYVSLARAEGFLPPTTPGKANA